jgi:hypothetical protein
MKTIILLVLFVSVGLKSANGAIFSESTVTEIIKDVSILPSVTRTATQAQLNQTVKAPDMVRTGSESRAELTAPDKTITRIGANTVFAFETSERVLNLQKGSLLFHSPKGAGGGTIKSGGASAAVLGTTLIVAATAEGGFKVIVLEGRGRVTLANGRSVVLHAGQMVYVLPNDETSGVLDINLGRLVAGSLLINGFSHELPSVHLLRDAVEQQTIQLTKGGSKDTGVSADDFVRQHKVGNGLGTLDDNTYSALVLPFARPQKPAP